MTAHKKSPPFALSAITLGRFEWHMELFQTSNGVSGRKANFTKDQGWWLIDLPLRASNEGLLRLRVARSTEDHQAPSLPHSASKGDD
jgi:hypothetical protein